jgi:hypothetical protein
MSEPIVLTTTPKSTKSSSSIRIDVLADAKADHAAPPCERLELGSVRSTSSPTTTTHWFSFYTIMIPQEPTSRITATMYINAATQQLAFTSAHRTLLPTCTLHQLIDWRSARHLPTAMAGPRSRQRSRQETQPDLQIAIFLFPFSGYFSQEPCHYLMLRTCCFFFFSFFFLEPSLGFYTL